MTREYDEACEDCEVHKEMVDRVEALEAAFPDGPEKHRDAHQHMIDSAEAEKAFWQAIKIEFAKRAIFGIIAVITAGILALMAKYVIVVKT